MFFDSGAVLSTSYCWRLIFWCFSFRGGSEKLNFALKNIFSSKFWSRTFFCHSWQFLRKMKKWDSLKVSKRNKNFIKMLKKHASEFYFCVFSSKSSPKLTRPGLKMRECFRWVFCFDPGRRRCHPWYISNDWLTA